jgi:hypothetical protein
VGLVEDEVVVDIGDPGQIDLVFERPLDALDSACPGVPGTEDDDVFSHGYICNPIGYKGFGTAGR